ncbi:MAG: aldo/keto reductase [Porticoccaceae bacterium]|jgi:aryl-alcohol dehydrogenase-like predicted oxidoreductase|nr:aldo/keto reductase [Porticoccaceae bacterium]
MVSLIRAAIERGIVFFDTAECYGEANETLVGEALAPIPDQVVIATKFGFKNRDYRMGFDSSPARIRRVVEQALKRLQADWIDLFLSAPSRSDAPVEDVAGARIPFQ